MKSADKLAILGTGNIGRAMARGLAGSGLLEPGQIVLTRRKVDKLADLAEKGFVVTDDNLRALAEASTVIVAVEPQQLDRLLAEIGPHLDSRRHRLISVVSGASIQAIRAHVSQSLPIVRAMPNTAMAMGQSMTCLATDDVGEPAMANAISIFDTVGRTQVIDERQMSQATALCACGIAFFLRAIRAASQGGIEIGFHPDEALTMAAQTALGAARLLLERGQHPEREIDRVTTPRGCTISGLNEMEHNGFSSAMIKAILTSSNKASTLYTPD